MLRFAQENHAASDNWSFVAASPDATALLVAALQPKGPASADLARHGSAVYLFDRAGRLMQRYAGAPLDQQRLLDHLARLTRVKFSGRA
ncbi:MAG: hypothetical protein QM756_09365 [Polyangiaceae bacterium]